MPQHAPALLSLEDATFRFFRKPALPANGETQEMMLSLYPSDLSPSRSLDLQKFMAVDQHA